MATATDLETGLAYDIEGLTVREDGRVFYSIGMELTNKEGKSIFRQEPKDLEATNRRWLSEQGRVLIITRDMSWSFGTDVMEALIRKATSGELTIYASRETDQLLLKLEDAAERRQLEANRKHWDR